MFDFLEKISEELNKKINKYEQKNGDLVKYYQKQLFDNFHSMYLQDDFFCDPDLICLQNYEKELNGHNKKR